MMNRSPQIVLIADAQIPAAREVLARAFFNDPLCVYAQPDLEARRSEFTWLFTKLVREGARQGGVYTNILLDRPDAVAVWMPALESPALTVRLTLSDGFIRKYLWRFKHSKMGLTRQDGELAMRKGLRKGLGTGSHPAGTDLTFQNERGRLKCRKSMFRREALYSNLSIIGSCVCKCGPGLPLWSRLHLVEQLSELVEGQSIFDHFPDHPTDR